MPHRKDTASVALTFPDPGRMRKIGIKTLRRMRSVKTYNDWCFHAVKRYVGGSVVEVGCGIGNMTSYFAGQLRLVCLDILPEAVALVNQQHDGADNVRALLGDIGDDDFIAALAGEPFDTCVSFNVLEHIADDAHALRNMARLLRPGGHCAMIVPGCTLLYGTLDRNLGHYRRYRPAMLAALLEQAGLERVEIRWMNFPGMFGWFVSSCVLRRAVLPRSALGAFNVLAPLFRRLEALCPPPVGQSLVCVGRKPAADGADTPQGSKGAGPHG
jgi:SAM-dependent methyltransferase